MHIFYLIALYILNVDTY